MSNIVKSDNNNAIQNTADFDIPRGYICTLDITTIEGKMQLATALNGATTMRDKVGEPLRVVNVVTAPGERSRTGEECINTYLFCEDGSVYFSQSEGVARSVKVLVALFTDGETGEFNPASMGIGFEVREQELQNGNTLKTVVPVSLD